MPSLLFPSGFTRRAGRGTFSCPACRAPREFSRVVVGRVLRVFGIRLPAGVYGEYIECTTCLSTFRPQVLAYDAVEAGENITAEYQRALLRVLAVLVAADGRIDEAEIATVQRVYAAVTGARLTRESVIEEVRDVAREPVTAARYLSRVAGFLNEHGKEQVLRGAVLVCGADGRVHQKEADMVRHLGEVMQLDEERVKRVLWDFG